MAKPTLLSAGRPSDKKAEMLEKLRETDEPKTETAASAEETPAVKPEAERKPAKKARAVEPWKGLDNERKSRGINLRMTEYELAQLQFIAENTEYSINSFLREAMLAQIKTTMPAAKRRYEEKSG